MQPSRWDLVLDLKPKPILDHVIDEVAKLFAKDLAAWPPEIESLDPSTGATVAALVQNHPFGPDPRVFTEAFTLARFDIARETDAFDDYVRNQRWMATGLPASEKAMILFASRFIVEQLLGLNEHTEGRVSRKHLLEIIDRTERQFFRKAPQS
jgi:hypothetical protein